MEDILPNQQIGVMDLPEERKREEENELQDVLKSRPILNDLMEWFDETIAETDSIEALQFDNFTNENDLRVQILAKRQLKYLLTSKKSELWSKMKSLQEESNG